MVPKLVLRFCVVLAAFLLAHGSTQAQTTIHVPTDQPTIQAAINAANGGDTVLVAPGTYNENIDFYGKAITVTSSGGPAVTTINGPNDTAAVVFLHFETRASILSNFTITAGGNNSGSLGGIHMENASPSILNNTITNTLCYGVFSSNSSPLIQGNEISYVQAHSNDCSFGGGAGIYLEGQVLGITPVVLGNTIENNTQSGLGDAGGNGGAGIAVWGGAPNILNNIIRFNATGRYQSLVGGGEGGGIFFNGSALGLVANNLIYGNTSNLDGGGIALKALVAGTPSLTLLNNTIVDNAVVPVTTYSQIVLGGQQVYLDAGQVGNISVVTFYNNLISGATTDARLGYPVSRYGRL